MPYGNNKGVEKEINRIKDKVSQERPDLDIDNMSSNDMKNILLNEINNNPNMNSSIKQKINSGDIEGLKEDVINYLGENKSNDGSSDDLIKMLKNNDMDGLKNQIMGMLLGGVNKQKKNEINDSNSEQGANSFQPDLNSIVGLLKGVDTSGLMKMLMGKMVEGRKNDSRVILLNSMKPFLSDKRQKSIDDCIRVINMMGFFENFQAR